MKKCTKCNKTKSIINFRFRNKKSINPVLNSWCRYCENKENLKRTIKKIKILPTTEEVLIKKELKRINSKKRMLMLRYKLEYSTYLKMYEEQNESCKICNEHKNLGGKDGLYVDHCHKTRKVRGLLCPQCNTMLGRFKDNPIYFENAISYLKC
jgi:uncharacterized protein (DUF2344 family)